MEQMAINIIIFLVTAVVVIALFVFYYKSIKWLNGLLEGCKEQEK